MTIQVSTTDQRTARALDVLATADQWLKIRRKSDGAKFYVVPGSNGRVYWVNLNECSCPDSQHRADLTCKHRIAVALHVARLKATQPKRTLCAACNGTSVYHMARCGRVRVPLLGRVCA